MVLNLPPQGIEAEGPVGCGETGVDALRFLVLDRVYMQWWATQFHGPLACPIEPEVKL